MPLPSLLSSLKTWACEVAKGAVIGHRVKYTSVQWVGGWFVRQKTHETQTIPTTATQQDYIVSVEVMTTASCEVVIDGWSIHCPGHGVQLRWLEFPRLMTTPIIQCQWKGQRWKPCKACVVMLTLLAVDSKATA